MAATFVDLAPADSTSPSPSASLPVRPSKTWPRPSPRDPEQNQQQLLAYRSSPDPSPNGSASTCPEDPATKPTASHAQIAAKASTMIASSSGTDSASAKPARIRTSATTSPSSRTPLKLFPLRRIEKHHGYRTVLTGVEDMRQLADSGGRIEAAISAHVHRALRSESGLQSALQSPQMNPRC